MGDEEGFKRPTLAIVILRGLGCAACIHASVMDSIRQETADEGETGERRGGTGGRA